MTGAAEYAWLVLASTVVMVVGYAAYATRGLRETSFRFSGLGLRVVVASKHTKTATALDPVFTRTRGTK